MADSENVPLLGNDNTFNYDRSGEVDPPINYEEDHTNRPADSTGCSEAKTFSRRESIRLYCMACPHIVNKIRMNFRATVTCRVCDATIDVEGKHNQHVVKCQHCQEATPIKPAPAGKKYVRCPCNCLLICKAASTRIACPRANCRRVITLANSAPTGMATRAPAGSCRVSCAHCQEVFMFNTLTNTLATCPHCKKNSSVGASFARSRYLMFLIAAVFALIGCVLITVLTSGKTHSYPFIYGMWVFSYLGMVYLFYRFLFYYLIKISTVVGPV